MDGYPSGEAINMVQAENQCFEEMSFKVTALENLASQTQVNLEEKEQRLEEAEAKYINETIQLYQTRTDLYESQAEADRFAEIGRLNVDTIESLTAQSEYLTNIVDGYDVSGKTKFVYAWCVTSTAAFARLVFKNMRHREYMHLLANM